MISRYRFTTLLREIGLILVAALWWFPFYLLVSTSFKTSTEAYASPFALPESINLDSYTQAWTSGSLGAALVNSLVITVGSVIVLILLGSLAAYVVARRGGRPGAVLYSLFLLGIALPFQLAVVPMYSAMRQIGLMGEYLGMILLYSALLMPMAVFLYVGFVRALPREYEEAAAVDGAGRFRTFVRIVFPLLRPITGTVAILTGLIVWNDFFLQLVFLSGSHRLTLPVAIYSFVGQYASQWNVVFAAVVVSIVPVLVFYLFAQRRLIQGFTSGIKS